MMSDHQKYPCCLSKSNEYKERLLVIQSGFPVDVFDSSIGGELFVEALVKSKKGLTSLMQLGFAGVLR